MIYFISDFHLGSPSLEISRNRETDICNWLDSIKSDATDIYFLGDIFDFWFEYKTVVPRGYIRFLGKLASLHDAGIRLHMCVGNHDLWIRDYLETECGVRVFREPEEIQAYGFHICIHHGDGLGPGDGKYKFLKKIFTNKVAQWFFYYLHPDLGFSMAHFFSRSSRTSEPKSEKVFKGNDKEFLVLYSEERLKERHFDFFIFGHRHLALDITLRNGHSRYINLGEWFVGRRYVQLGPEGLKVCEFG